MKRSFSITALGPDPDRESLVFAREIGFEYVDENAYSWNRHIGNEGEYDYAKAARLYEEVGLQVGSIHGPCVDLSSPKEEERSDGLRRCYAAVDALLVMGGDILVMHPSYPVDKSVPLDVRLKYSVESLKILADKCAAKGVRLAVENLLWRELYSSSEVMLDIMHQMDGSAGLCFDTCHASISKEGLESMITALAPHVIMTHISDSFLEDDDHYPPGLGLQDLPMVIRTLKASGYSGVYNFEIDAMTPKRVISATRKWTDTLE